MSSTYIGGLQVKSNATFILSLTFFLMLTACSSINIEQYRENKPELDLFEYFTGHINGWGIVQDRKGRLTRQFSVSITGTVNSDNDLELVEHFLWNDGEKTQRIWTISRAADNNYSGVAADVNGKAHGISAGSVLNWRYQLMIPVDGKSWSISFDDWMFLQPDNILLNKATMKKFGFRVGEITIAFIKET